MSRKDGLIYRLTRNKCTQETTCKRIASAVGVDNLFILQRIHGENFRTVRVCCCNNERRFGTLGNDDCARPRSVRLGKRCDRLGNSGDIILVGKSYGTRPGCRLALIANNKVTIREDLLELNFEELRYERS